MKNFIYSNALVLASVWGLIIFVLCATPGEYIPSANWLELLSFDKFVHASVFFVLSSLVLIAAVKYQKGEIAIIFFFLMCIAYGALLELMQATIFSNRSADWKDMIANTFGCLVGFLFLKRIRIFVSEFSRRS